jgi:sodium-dependent dicarboxylate transporter 2/3/5
MGERLRMTPWKIGGLIAGVLAFISLTAMNSPLQHYGAWGNRPAYAAAVAALMAIWWLTEALPIYVTACVPLALFPLLNVFGKGFAGNLTETTFAYLDPYNFLFAGGMCIAAAMQQCHLHRRIALNIMRLIGTDPRRLLFGLLCATAFISLWISNTATATMMVPIALSIIVQLEQQRGNRRLEHYGATIMMAVAYAANLGGIGTKIGTAPNAQFAGFMHGLGIDISFLQFMAVGFPFVVFFLPVAWLMLWRLGRADHLQGDLGATIIADELNKLGPMKKTELIVLAVFLCTAGLWIVGKPLTGIVQSWLSGVKITTAHVEGGTAMLSAFVLLAWRWGGRQVLELRSLRLVPWETLLLLGGGFALAAGIQKSGFSEWMGARLSMIYNFPPFAQVLLASAATVAISAVASNTATIAVMLNVLKDAVAPAMRTTVLFAATIAASCDFALPAGTPPNAIVFGSGYVTIPQMAKTGVVLDVAAAVLAACWCWVIVRAVM